MSRHETGDRPTRAMILAAGPGARLRPVTAQVPKCMVPLGGKPLLEYTITWLRKYQITDVIINLHYLPDAVPGYFGDGARWGVRITYSVEREILGTAGGVKNVERLFTDPFFVWYGDNVSTCRLNRLWDHHRAKGGLATIVLHHREDPTQSGIVALDGEDRITRFLEKPKPHEVFSRWVNAGIFVLDPKVVEAIPARRAVDFGKDIFPALLARGKPLYGYRMTGNERLWWIDTPEDLRRLAGLWEAERARLDE